MDVVTMARTAREGFARGLGALQTPGVPPELISAAEPIAQAMSALHSIESTRGVGGAEAGAAALGAARQALAQLQAGAGTGHPAAQQAIEAVAGSLGLVHQISQLVVQASVVPVPPTQPSSAYAGVPEPQPQVAVVNPGWQQPAHAVQQPVNPVGQTQLAPNQGYQPPPAWPAAPHAPAPAAVGPSGVARVDAELGAHSATNFYKGLSGNDVVDSGGIFIATYNVVEIGTPLVVKVSLPGGYEFEAQAVVRWTRDAPLSGANSPPGYGAQFTQITPEARQLIYRYVRNREPLFHDDL